MGLSLEALCFLISIFAGLTIIFLSATSFFTRKLQFWPPPGRRSWQMKLFWILFIFFSLPLFFFIALDFDKRNTNDFLFILGASLSLVGLILANLVSYNLGFKNTSGQEDQLRISGWYSFSRNPVYVFTILALAGVIITVPTFKIIVISSVWIFIYILAPFIEEPWLEDRYGREFLDYKRRVRRFF